MATRTPVPGAVRAATAFESSSDSLVPLRSNVEDTILTGPFRPVHLPIGSLHEFPERCRPTGHGGDANGDGQRALYGRVLPGPAECFDVSADTLGDLGGGSGSALTTTMNSSPP